jgi:hypothetical protein
MRKLKLEEVFIIKYAAAIRNIQKTQVQQYQLLIEKELARFIPSLNDKTEDGLTDWMCDIVNCETDEEVLDTLDRIQAIEQENTKNNWKCKYCNKSTFDVDCEYLFGTDHIECALENEQSDQPQSQDNAKLWNQIARMQDYITQLESRLNQLETQYEEPTN